MVKVTGKSSNETNIKGKSSNESQLKGKASNESQLTGKVYTRDEKINITVDGVCFPLCFPLCFNSKTFLGLTGKQSNE